MLTLNYPNMWMVGCLHGSVFLHLGEFGEVMRWLEERVELQQQLEALREAGESSNVYTAELWYFHQYVGRSLQRHGLHKLARRALEMLRVSSCADSSKYCDDCWPVVSSVYVKPSVGEESYNRRLVILDHWLVHGAESDADLVETIVTSDPDEVCRTDRQTALGQQWPTGGYSLAEACALVAECRGLTELAHRYATHVVAEIQNISPRVNARLVLARLARARGDESSALTQFEAAADEAMPLQPMMAHKCGRECGGPTGQRIMDAAIASTERPSEQALAELVDAIGSHWDLQRKMSYHAQL